MRYVTAIITIFVSAIVLWSCSSEHESELELGFPCTTIKIYIKDSHGNNLLSSETEGNWRGQPFKILYNDTIYTVSWENISRPMNEWMIARFDGLVAWRKTVNTPDSVYISNCLEFGQFSGSRSLEMDFKFFVPGDDVPYNLRFEQIVYELYNNDETIILDGKESKGTSVTIILPKKEDSGDTDNP